MMTVGILDYGVGNVGSIENMLKHLGAKTLRCSSPNFENKVDCLILPGVGSFDNAMKKLGEGGFIDPLNSFALKQRKPILGICVGMHVMGRGSEEGKEKGLGWFNFKASRIVPIEKLKIPHMGWNYVKLHGKWLSNSPLLKNSRFYFCHSFCVSAEPAHEVMMSCTYGVKIAAGLQLQNLVGVQFHPEKSHIFGLKFMEWFLDFAGENI